MECHGTRALEASALAFHIERSESVERALQRCADEQFGKAIGELRDDTIDRADAVHQVRKRMKKLRGAIRLVRPALGGQYKRLNRRFRDTGQRLSRQRDADVMLEAFDATIAWTDEPHLGDRYAPIRAALDAHRDALLADAGDVDALAEQTADELGRERAAASRWSLDENGFDAIAGGLAKTYGRARNAMAAAWDEPNDEALHAWRKRVKYHRYHTRLLQRAWPKPMKARRRELKQLSDLLGDDHDLAVLGATAGRMTDRLAGDLVVGFTTVLSARRRRLQRDAWPLGARLFAEKPKHHVRRIGRYWAAWRGDSARDPFRAAAG